MAGATREADGYDPKSNDAGENTDASDRKRDEVVAGGLLGRRNAKKECSNVEKSYRGVVDLGPDLRIQKSDAERASVPWWSSTNYIAGWTAKRTIVPPDRVAASHERDTVDANDAGLL
uniref:Uncharacterized protein n=1 Tax=Ustilago esculenta TaxID=185366 RepID=A0A481SHN3_9BASI|nr:hypothetical protein UEMT_2020 [Ustilago esculenta]